MPAFICFFLLFLLPFLIAPFGVTEFENPKVVVGEGGVILLLLYSLFTNKVHFQQNTRQVALYLAILLVTVIDILFFRTQISFFGNVFRMQGIFLLWLLLLFSLLSKEQTFRKIPWYIFGSLAALEAIVVFFLPLNASQRFVGTLGEPNALAAFIIFLWPFAFFAVKKFSLKEKIGSGILFFLVILLLFLTDSKSAMIAFGIQVLYIFLYRKNIATKKIVLICAALYLGSYGIPFFEHIPYENRVEVWQSAIHAGFTRPLLGNGFGNTEFALHTAAHTLGLPIQYYYVDSSHNIFLDWWVQAGIVGIGVLLTIVYYITSYFIRTKNRREFTILVGMITVLSFNPASIIGLIGFWWLVGQGLLEKNKPN